MEAEVVAATTAPTHAPVHAFQDDPPPPDWVWEAATEGLVTALTTAAHASLGTDGQPFSTAAVAGVQALEALDPRQLAQSGHPKAVVSGIVAAQRLLNHVEALQQEWIAALARPGASMALIDLVEACRGAGQRLSAPFMAPEDFPDNLPTDEEGRPCLDALVDHPQWRAALATASARVGAAEVGSALALSPATARRRTEDALHQVDHLPQVHALRASGELDGYRAAIIAEETACLRDQPRSIVERRVAPSAAALTPSRLRSVLRREVIAADPEAAHERAVEAAVRRGVQVDPDRDDMAIFRAVVNAADAQVACGVLDGIATSLTQAGQGARRGRSQLRADAFVDIFHSLATTGSAHITGRRQEDLPPQATSDGDAAMSRARTGMVTGCASAATRRTARPPRVNLNVYVSAETLAGLSEAAAELDGYGSITAATAKALAASADSVRSIVIAPRAGRQQQAREHVTAEQLAADQSFDELHSPAQLAARQFTARQRTARQPTARRPATEPFPAHQSSAAHPADPGGGHSAWTGAHEETGHRASVCGSHFDVGRRVYLPPASLADHVRTRDRHCQFPGCRATAARCDIDHRRPFSGGGATCACNLDLLCRFHHQLKTFTPWRADPDPVTGLLRWISPTGHMYPVDHTHLLANDNRASQSPPDMVGADGEPPPF